MPCFRIEILTQHWLEPAPRPHRRRRLPRWMHRMPHDDVPCDPARFDLCSHGRIKLVIGDQTISGEDNDMEYGISETALGLLRTLESDHSREAPVVCDDLVASGSGALLMIGDPIGIDWSVEHLSGDRVRIKNVLRHDTTYYADAIPFDIDCELSEDEYRSQIISFALKAKQLFAEVEKEFADAYKQQMYEGFWREYDGYLSRASFATGSSD